AVPELIRAVDDPDSTLRITSIRSLGMIGPAAKDAVPALTKVLQDGNAAVRMDAMMALGMIGPAAKDAVPTLIQVLRNAPQISAPFSWLRPDLEIYRRAAEAAMSILAAKTLGEIGPAAQAAVPDLFGLLQHPELGLRLLAAEALAKIASEG